MWRTIFRSESIKFYKSPTVWFAAALCFAALSFLFYQLSTDYFTQVRLALKAQGHLFGFTREVVKPFWGWVLFLMMLLTPLLTANNLSLEFNRKTFNFWTLHRVPAKSLVLGKYFALLMLQTLLLFLFLIIPLSICLITTPDWGLLLSGFVCCWLVTAFSSAFCLAVHFFVPSLILSGLIFLGGIVMLALLPWLVPFVFLKPFAANLSPIEHAHALMNGRFIFADLFYFIFSLGALMILSMWGASRRLLQIL